jgi:hypothetical protein
MMFEVLRSHLNRMCVACCIPFMSGLLTILSLMVHSTKCHQKLICISHCLHTGTSLKLAQGSGGSRQNSLNSTASPGLARTLACSRGCSDCLEKRKESHEQALDGSSPWWCLVATKTLREFHESVSAVA